MSKELKILKKLEVDLQESEERAKELENQLQYIRKRRKADRYKGQDIYREWYWQNKDYYNNLIDKTNCCFYCELPMFRGEIRRDINNNPIYDSDHPTLDHILPKSMFPQYADKLDNFVVACHKCNRKKGIDVTQALEVLSQRVIDVIK